MTFQALASYVAANVAPDGDSVHSPKTTNDHLATPFGARIAFLIDCFTRDVPLLFATMSPIAIPENAREYSLAEPTNTALAFHTVWVLWIKGREIRKADSAGEVMRLWGLGSRVGVPTAFAHVTRNKLVFDMFPSDGLTECYARGFYRHAPIVSAEQTIEPDLADVLDLFDAYAQANLRKHVAGDDVGLERLRTFNEDAYRAVLRIKGERMRALLDTRRPI